MDLQVLFYPILLCYPILFRHRQNLEAQTASAPSISLSGKLILFLEGLTFDPPDTHCPDKTYVSWISFVISFPLSSWFDKIHVIPSNTIGEICEEISCPKEIWTAPSQDLTSVYMHLSMSICTYVFLFHSSLQDYTTWNQPSLFIFLCICHRLRPPALYAYPSLVFCKNFSEE